MVEFSFNSIFSARSKEPTSLSKSAGSSIYNSFFFLVTIFFFFKIAFGTVGFFSKVVFLVKDFYNDSLSADATFDLVNTEFLFLMLLFLDKTDNLGIFAEDSRAD